MELWHWQSRVTGSQVSIRGVEALVGGVHLFIVTTDHRNLEYLQTTKRLNPQQARWALFSPFPTSHSHINRDPKTQRLRPSMPPHLRSSVPAAQEYLTPPYVSFICYPMFPSCHQMGIWPRVGADYTISGTCWMSSSMHLCTTPTDSLGTHIPSHRSPQYATHMQTLKGEILVEEHDGWNK